MGGVPGPGDGGQSGPVGAETRWPGGGAEGGWLAAAGWLWQQTDHQE